MANNLTWEQKAIAMTMLCGGHQHFSLHVSPDDGLWCCKAIDRNIAVGPGHLSGKAGGGKSPEDAINEDWDFHVTGLPHGQYIEIDHGKNDRQPKYYRWNGFMWQEHKPAWLYL